MPGRIISTWRDPYDCGFTPTRPKHIEIKPGLTVLVGCNGAGKTTLLNNIKAELAKADIPCHMYSNLYDGGTNSVSAAFYDNDCSLGATLMCSSEGECISLNFGKLLSKVRGFLQVGEIDTRWNRVSKAMRSLNGESEEDKELSKERWLLFDAIDSGLSIDSVVEIVDVFNLILKDAANLWVEAYIVISANGYELCRGNQCFDVNTGKYLTFSDYEEYRKFILKSRDKKDKQYKGNPIDAEVKE